MERPGNACRRGGARGVTFHGRQGLGTFRAAPGHACSRARERFLPCACMSALCNRAKCVSHAWRQGGVPWYDGARGLHFMLHGRVTPAVHFMPCTSGTVHAAIVAVVLHMTSAEFIMLPDQKRMCALPHRPPFPWRAPQLHCLGHRVPSDPLFVEKNSRATES